MQAVVHDRYGPLEVLRLEEVEQPVPKDDEVLIRIHATTVNRTDTGLRSAEYIISRFFTGLLRPKHRILGNELAGVVEAAGAAVKEFAVGDHVFGSSGFGAHAEYICLREGAALAHMPAGLAFEEAAAVPDGAILALSYLRPAHVGEEHRVLVYGASGSIGTAAVQLARYLGAYVTAVTSTRNVELVRSLGADEVVDYTKEDFTKSGARYDLVFDAVGKHSFGRSRGSLRRSGMYAATDLGYLWQNPALALLTSRVGKQKVLFPIPRYTKTDVLFVKEAIEAGRYRAVIDRRYPLEQVHEAARYVETGRKAGNVVLTVGGDGES